MVFQQKQEIDVKVGMAKMKIDQMALHLQIKGEKITLDLEINLQNQIQPNDEVPIHLSILGEGKLRLQILFSILFNISNEMNNPMKLTSSIRNMIIKRKY